MITIKQIKQQIKQNEWEQLAATIDKDHNRSLELLQARINLLVLLSNLLETQLNKKQLIKGAS